MIFFNGLVNGICNIGVTCFILISGYYGVQFKLKKLVKMECMMISYSLLEILLMYLVMPEQLQGAALLEQLVKSLLPFISRKYWFYSCYVFDAAKWVYSETDRCTETGRNEKIVDIDDYSFRCAAYDFLL